MNRESPPLSPNTSKKEDPIGDSNIPASPSATTTDNQLDEREPTPPPLTTEEEWVEYVDSFGRSRRCLRKDLPEFMKLDQQLEAKKQEKKRERNRYI